MSERGLWLWGELIVCLMVLWIGLFRVARVEVRLVELSFILYYSFVISTRFSGS